MWYEMLRGLAYRKIRHDKMHWWQTTMPGILTVVISLALLALPNQPLLLTKDGLLAASLSVLSTLPGFYFAGLAAVATFNGLNMDAVMQAPAPVIDVKVGGGTSELTLSRRQLLSYLFSYLVIISFALCAITLAFLAATNSIYALHTKMIAHQVGYLWPWLRGVGVITYIALLSSLVITSLHGMYFLTERIHQP